MPGSLCTLHLRLFTLATDPATGAALNAFSPASDAGLNKRSKTHQLTIHQEIPVPPV